MYSSLELWWWWFKFSWLVWVRERHQNPDRVTLMTNFILVLCFWVASCLVPSSFLTSSSFSVVAFGQRVTTLLASSILVFVRQRYLTKKYNHKFLFYHFQYNLKIRAVQFTLMLSKIFSMNWNFLFVRASKDPDLCRRDIDTILVNTWYSIFSYFFLGKGSFSPDPENFWDRLLMDDYGTTEMSKIPV